MSGARPDSASSPAFGEADLSNCEREQIHIAGSIQPHGARLVASEPDLIIRQASANAKDPLKLEHRCDCSVADPTNFLKLGRLSDISLSPENSGDPSALRASG